MNDARQAAEPSCTRRKAGADLVGACRVGALAGAALVFAACSSGSGDAMSAGHSLYEAQCQMCHGETALGDGPMAGSLPVTPVSLIEHLGHHTRDELTRLIIAGIPPAMPPAAVGEEEIGLIVDYLWTLVPTDQVAALREMQRQVEAAGRGNAAMPGMAPDSSGSGEPQEYDFRGTIVRIDEATRIVAVENEDIPGWMMSMTMNYYVQPPEVLETLASGDRITAKVYAGDLQNLYEVEALPE